MHNLNMSYFYIFSNSPGEIFAWVKPLCERLAIEFPEKKIHVFLTPCQYATGEEFRVCKSFKNVRKIYSPKQTLRHILSPSSFTPGIVFFMGGDPMHAKRFAKKTRSKLVGYFNSKPSIKGFDYFFYRSTSTDLMAENIQHVPFEHRQGTVLLPGSRPEHLEIALPLMLKLSKTIKEKTILLSPFISNKTVNELKEKYPHQMIQRMNNSQDLSTFKTAITIPGTNTMQLAYYQIPYIMILPTHNSKILRLNGLMGLLLFIPIIGRVLKYIIISLKVKKHHLYSLPNQHFKEHICPEIIGKFSIESAKKTVNSFMADTKKQASIIEKFKPLLPKKNALDDVMKWLKKEIN